MLMKTHKHIKCGMHLHFSCRHVCTYLVDEILHICTFTYINCTNFDFKFKFKFISATFSKNTINKRKYNDNIRISDNMIVHKKNHSKSCSINQLNSKWSKIIAFSLVTSVVAEAVIINTRNNVWCDGSLPLKTRLSKKKYWFLGLSLKILTFYSPKTAKSSYFFSVAEK